MEQRKSLKEVLKRLYSLLDWKQKRSFLLIVFIMILSAGLSQLTPKAIGWLTDDILGQSGLDFSGIIPMLLFILAVNVFNELIKIWRRIIVEDTATKTEKKARGMAILSLLRAPLSYFKKNMTGNIHGRLNRCLEGTVKLEKLIFMDFAPAIFNSIAAVVVIFTTLPVILALPMLLVIPIGTAIVLRQIKTQKGIRVELLETKAAMDGTVVELLNGIEVIRISDSVDREKERFDGRSEFLRAKEMKHHIQMAKYDSLKFINEAFFTVLMIGVSSFLAASGKITVGSVLTAYLCFTQLIKPLEELHRILDELSECTILAEDFFAMLELPADFSYRTLPAAQGALTTCGSMVQLRDVSFHYEQGELLLHHVNLDIPRGFFLGIAGPSGCGKSSLIKLVCRLEKGEGDIFLDGKDISTLSRREISKLIALVPQTPFLIAGTLRENICYGLDREVSDAELEEAARKACLSQFVDSLPERFEFAVSEAGGNLSGGQKQRIAIARVFLRKPKLLLLDEATSALDNTTEKQIQQQIEELRTAEDITILAIAHRLTTLRKCDEIIVINHGKIEQRGSFDALLREPGIFGDMYYGRLK